MSPFSFPALFSCSRRGLLDQGQVALLPDELSVSERSLQQAFEGDLLVGGARGDVRHRVLVEDLLERHGVELDAGGGHPHRLDLEEVVPDGRLDDLDRGVHDLDVDDSDPLGRAPLFPDGRDPV